MKILPIAGVQPACLSDPSAIDALDTPRWKRGLDQLCILLILPGLLPLILLVTLIVRMGSRGPVLFKQTRIGLGGQPFTIYKFRTMQAGAPTVVHEQHVRELMTSNRPLEKLDARGDARLIPLGRWLRATGLDELAQIFNILRGDMSLVGPRPCLPSEYALYQPWMKQRFSTLPGLTGLWQVSGKNRTTFEEMIRLDNEYARHPALWLDVKIILLTFPAVWRQVHDLRSVKAVMVASAPQPNLPSQTSQASQGLLVAPLENR